MRSMSRSRYGASLQFTNIEALRLARAKAMRNEGFGQYTEASTEKEVLDFTTSVQP